MIIVQMSGGLGNQMFQYALYRQLLAMGREAKIDDETCYVDAGTRARQLSIFGISYVRATREELVSLTDARMDFASRIRRKIFGRNTKSYRERQFNFDEHIFQMEEAYLEGCWQSEKYFPLVKEELKQQFTIQMPLSEATREYVKKIEQTEAISVHIRRGDYLNEAQQVTYGGICTDSYYKKAVELMQERHPEAIFYLFSNDPAWVKEHMTGERFKIVDCNEESTGYLDMFLMSRCQHHIIANSSFSWWGAWLNQNPDKEIIAPKKWLNGKDCSDIYTDHMLAI